jgi:transposase
MGQNFLPDTVNQILMFPPSLHDWLPEGHLARFLVDVVSALDLGAVYASYSEKDGRGQAAYAPELMVRLLLYGYATGVYSSRKIQARTYEDIAFRFLSGDQHPDHATIAEFRKRHLEALASLFMQALLLCEKAGLVKLGHVSIDGTKIKANASKHKAMSYKRMNETEARLEQETCCFQVHDHQRAINETVAAKLSPESDLTFEFLRPVPIEQTRITQVVKGIDFQ